MTGDVHLSLRKSSCKWKKTDGSPGCRHKESSVGLQLRRKLDVFKQNKKKKYGRLINEINLFLKTFIPHSNNPEDTFGRRRLRKLQGGVRAGPLDA